MSHTVHWHVINDKRGTEITFYFVLVVSYLGKML